MVPNRKPDGEFNSFSTWVQKAASWIGGTNPLCVDAKDRVLKNGGDFARARDEDAFPVRFWFNEGGMNEEEKKKSIKAWKAHMKIAYPWRQY